MPYLAVDLQMIFPAEESHDVQGKDTDNNSETSRRPIKSRCHTRNKLFTRCQLSSDEVDPVSKDPGSRWLAWRAWGEMFGSM
jgi:hypothetical protein